MNVAPSEGQTLSVGIYEDATRWPFQETDEPGFDFSGDGRGCNELFADYEILEVVIDENQGIQSFALDFTQQCEFIDAPELKGKVRINSLLPINN
jgi:hypothetical protein